MTSVILQSDMFCTWFQIIVTSISYDLLVSVNYAMNVLYWMMFVPFWNIKTLHNMHQF